MNLWIRSQDREDLINNPLRIYYDSNYEGVHKIIANTHDETIWLGKYKTKERALEVLDEIQNILLHKYVIRIDENTQEVAKFLNIDGAYVSTKTNGDVRNINNTFIYEMPEE